MESESGTHSKICVIKFETFLLDVATRSLYDCGTLVHVEPKAFDVMVTLVLARHRVVTRGELLARHWEGNVVCDGAVGQCIWYIRKLLHDSASNPRFIRTIARRGYHFVGAVEIIGDSDAHGALRELAQVRP